MSTLRIHHFQHVPFEGLASIEDWARAHGHTLSATFFFAAEPVLPALAEIDWLIVMGGPMGVYDEDKYPWLGREKAFIREAIDAGKTVLGICLGAQLIASALGSAVYPGPQREIGWWPIDKTAAGRSHPLFVDLPDEFTVLHWHGDTFDLPAGAELIASSAACANQAFVVGERVVGLQFHFEATAASVRQMIAGDPDDLKAAGQYIQSEQTLLANLHHVADNNRIMAALLTRLAAG